MTDTQWLLDLVEKATPGPWHTVSLPTQTQVRNIDDARVCTRAYSRDARLIALAPDLARFVCLAAAPDKWDEFLTRFAELKP